MTQGAKILVVVAELLFPLLLAASAARAESLAKTRTDAGWISGLREGGLAVYKGVPFAEPPVGELRWKPPRPALRWQGVKVATAFAPACIQSPNPMMNVPTQPRSEDCLYLNIWTPAQAGRDHAPVLVWIHGGAFAFGSTAMPLFDGANLARKGVVVVSVAYRVGPFGFLAHPELSAESPHHVSGNYGLLDQIAALRWIRANIEAFGGNPRRVTIMGESAGAISVSMLAQSPLARGLFAGIIAQSGAAFALPEGLAMTLPEAETVGQAWTEAAGAGSLEQLRALPASQLLESTPALGSLFSLASSWPVRDGHVLPADPAESYRERQFSDTPILIGSNDDEGSIFNAARTRDAYLASLSERFGKDVGRVLAAYPAQGEDEAAVSASALLGDTTFILPQVHWSRLQSRFGRERVYYYHFAHTPPARPGVKPGPIHGAELPYVFDNLAVRKIGWTEDDRAIAELLSTYWTNFAKSGDPNGPGLPEWPVFSNARPSVLWLREGQASVGAVPRPERLELLDAILAHRESVR